MCQMNFNLVASELFVLIYKQINEFQKNNNKNIQIDKKRASNMLWIVVASEQNMNKKGNKTEPKQRTTEHCN